MKSLDFCSCITFPKSKTAILSRDEKLEFKGGESKEFGVAITKESEILLLNCHFSDQPYVAFEADGIKYDVKNDPTNDVNELFRRSFSSRVDTLKSISKVISEKNVPIIVAGDFNEPSHRDWTEETTNEGITPFPMIFPTSYIFEHKFGFLDTYRYIHKNPLVYPGITWPSTPKEIKYPYREDRIDFIYVKNLIPQASEVLNIKSLSDHNVLATRVLM